MHPALIPLRDRFMAGLTQRMWRHLPRAVDLRGQVADAWDAVHSCPDRPFVIDVPLSDCLGLMPVAFRCDKRGGHPFVETLLGIIDGRVTGYAGSPLKDYYRNWQPATAAEVLGVHGATVLRWMPPLASPLPWDRLSPADHLRLWSDIARRDYHENGFDLPPEAGWKGWGPMRDEAGEVELARLCRTLAAIRRYGYRRHNAYDGDIAGQALCHGGRIRFALGPGQHRVAALSALGYQDIPLRCDPHFIRREDVDRWPNVRRGIYGTDQALAVFDRIFAAARPLAEPADAPPAALGMQVCATVASDVTGF